MRKFFPLLLFFGIAANSFGTHLRGGQITTRVIDCASHTYEITITIYTNSSAGIPVGDGTLLFGDGVSFPVPNFTSAILDMTNSVGIAVYKINHTYATEKGFTISYSEVNRNAGILNLKNSIGAAFSISSYVLVNSSLCQSTIQFEIPPIDLACSQLAFTHNPGANVPLGDSLSYQLVAPAQGENIPADGYQNPNDAAFYTSNYQTANEEGNGPPTYSIDPGGTLNWNAPGNIGEYAVAIKVFQWTYLNGAWVNVAWVVRDMQIIVKDCQATRPYLLLPSTLCAMVGDTVIQDFKAKDKEGNPVKVEVTTFDNFQSSPLTFQYVGVNQSTQTPHDTAHVKLKWIITCGFPRPQAYRFVFKTSAYLKNGVRISSFQTWDVKVNGPPPAFRSLNLDVSKKSLNLTWKNYPCENASVVQVWRRVDHFSPNVNSCTPGIPASWGFVKIGESSTGNFVDRSLSAGATYCYRLLAVYSVADKIVSLVSKDTCIGPLIVDAPVMTKVSIDKTNKTNGRVNLVWTSPFQINKQTFTPPYQYDLLKTVDETNFQLVKSKMTDTTFVDSPSNTLESTIGYKVIVYSPTSVAGENPIDTSSVAYSPRLVFKSLQNGIALNWRTETPWSNRSSRFPWHYIYRKDVDDVNFQLMDSINVTEIDSSVFYYVDEGKIARFAFTPNVVYGYRIETQGAYGNPLIREPLRNFSNEIHAQPIDKDPPCAPTLEITAMPCELIKSSPCSITNFKNSLRWTYPPGCGNDVASFNVYFLENREADSTLIASTVDFSFDHNKQVSMAGCYEVTAVDYFGNVSKPSLKVCVENCLNVFIPNVVTINSDGLNESFPGFADGSDKRDPSTCPRFVQEYSLQIFNSWGERVYSVDNLSPSESNFEWKGWDEKGKELPTGIYYYSTDINFNSLDPKLKTRNVKGWVNLIR